MWHGRGKPMFAGWDGIEDIIKCPNCNRTTQVQLVDTTRSEDTVLEVYQCKCGVKVHRFLKMYMDVYFSPDGTIIGNEKY